MKLSHILPLVVGSAAAGILASTSPAHALDFNFNFTGNDGNTVGGTIYGLEDNATSAASDVVVTSASNTLHSVVGSVFQFQSNTTNLFSNSFTVSNGVLTNASFDIRKEGLSLLLGNNSLGWNFYYTTDLSTANYNGFSGAIYSPAAATVPFDIPGGATIPSVGALLALGAMRKARKSIASKTRLANPVCASVS
jgi:hypothetical protein